MLDLGLCNLGSVRNALARIGVPALVTDHAGGVERAEHLILPGVGSFADGMARLAERSLIGPIRRHAAEGRPLLGICLGMQLLAETGTEGGTRPGLGLIPGGVVPLTPTPGVRVPNIGWCDVDPAPDAEARAGAAFYFAHSYHLAPEDPAAVTATVDVGGPVAAMVRRGAVVGVQFHPEKSQDAGLDLLHELIVGAAVAA